MSWWCSRRRRCGSCREAGSFGSLSIPVGGAGGDDEEKKTKKDDEEDGDDEPPRVPANAAKAANEHRRAPHEGKSAREQLVSLDFILLAAWFTVMFLPTNYFIISVGDQLEGMGDDDGEMTRGFQLVWVISTVLSPIAGYSADVVGRGSTMTFAMGCYVASFAMLGFGGDGEQLVALSPVAQLRLLQRGAAVGVQHVLRVRGGGSSASGTTARRRARGCCSAPMSTPLAVPMHQSGVDGGFGESNLASAMICLGLTPYTMGWAWRREITEEGMRGFPARWGIRREEEAEEEEAAQTRCDFNQSIDGDTFFATSEKSKAGNTCVSIGLEQRSNLAFASYDFRVR